MKSSFFLLGILALCGSCVSQQDLKTSVADDEMIEYKVKPGQYAVVVILDETVTLDQARKAARKRAAELAVSGGYRYFLVQSETEMRVMKQRAMLEKENDEEMYVEGDFGQGQIAVSSTHEAVFPALRVVIQCFEQKPKCKCIKACKLTDCSKLECSP